MIGIIKLLMLFSGEPMTREVYVDICTESLAKLSLEQKIERSMDCSYVDGKRVDEYRN